MCQMGHGRGFGPGHGYGGMRGHHGYCVGGLMHPGFGCCSGMGFWRRFISPAEELERLGEYLEELKKETAGVEARIHELKGK